MSKKNLPTMTIRLGDRAVIFSHRGGSAVASQRLEAAIVAGEIAWKKRSIAFPLLTAAGMVRPANGDGLHITVELLDDDDRQEAAAWACNVSQLVLDDGDWHSANALFGEVQDLMASLETDGSSLDAEPPSLGADTETQEIRAVADSGPGDASLGTGSGASLGAPDGIAASLGAARTSTERSAASRARRRMLGIVGCYVDVPADDRPLMRALAKALRADGGDGLRDDLRAALR